MLNGQKLQGTTTCAEVYDCLVAYQVWLCPNGPRSRWRTSSLSSPWSTTSPSVIMIPDSFSRLVECTTLISPPSSLTWSSLTTNHFFQFLYCFLVLCLRVIALFCFWQVLKRILGITGNFVLFHTNAKIPHGNRNLDFSYLFPFLFWLTRSITLRSLHGSAFDRDHAL